MAGSGTREDPWDLVTANGGSAYRMWRDEAADPPALVCQVGSTQLRYHLRAIEDLHAWLREEIAQGTIPLPTRRAGTGCCSGLCAL